MAHKTWHVEIDGRQHTIEVKHELFSSNREIYVNKRLTASDQPLLDFGSIHDFKVGGSSVAVVIYPNFWFTYSFDLLVNGISLEQGRPVEPIRTIPQWTWIPILLIVAALRPMFYMEGLLPVLLAWEIIGVATGYCIVAARNSYIALPIRVLVCMVATLLCWLAIVTMTPGWWFV